MLRRPVLLLIALSAAVPSLLAEPAEKPAGRSLAQRFGSIEQNKNLTFDPGRVSTGQARSFVTVDRVQSLTFHYDQKLLSSSFQTKEFQSKPSWFSKLKFWSRDANTSGGHEIPNISRQAETKTALVNDSQFANKTAAVRSLPDGDRLYLGPERAKLDRAVDPNKPLPGWTDDKFGTLTLEQIRELLNKNK